MRFMGWTGGQSRRRDDGGLEAIVEDGGGAALEVEPKFAVPVDSEHKATTLPLWTAGQPHMRAFHLAWISFFTCFVSTFAAPPLMPVIRDNLNLTSADVSHSGIASVSGTILSRLIMGTVCDLVGPRYGCATLMLLTAPAVFAMATVSSPTGFVLTRFFISFSLASFVTCQFWVSTMFSSKISGVANGTAAGWGNLGGGATQLLMPLVFSVIKNRLHSTSFTAWRLSFFVPGMLHIFCGFAVLLLGRDLPDGNYRVLKKRGVKHSDKFSRILKAAVTNYRMWILGLTYGFSFGLELTIDNVLAEYYYDHFNLNLNRAGIIASVFGLMNIFTRPCGGILSDAISKSFGMRGRLWILWLLQSTGGMLCIVLGNVTTLAASVSVMVIFSIFVQAACGATFGIVPFISRRALGMVSGFVGAGGSIGSVLTHVLILKADSTNQGFVHIGIMTICCTLPLWMVHFPSWGGMISCPSLLTEEDYYGSEWTESEKETGVHLPSLEFAANSWSERGRWFPVQESVSAHGGF
ncbi:hypothetical protein KC19_1G318600 [Ceratodon purpureus]|uniref:Major facilitator superfamily (MFS) profile domain-containing protein n=1 Tax=Ceratodon purpureus TaxID=3225 RepID=A0A8T0JBV7_CERPU|nr:hypothetical protein KC19_1G318600 [Ceratodon purpureus]